MSATELIDGGRVTIPRRWCESVTVEYKIYVVEPGDLSGEDFEGGVRHRGLVARSIPSEPREARPKPA